MPRNIALFCAYYPPHIGGVERYTHCLAEELARRGHFITIITSKTEAEDKQISKNIRILTIPSFSLMGNRFPVPKPQKDTLAAIRNITRMQFDAVIVNTRYYPISIIGCLTAKNNNRRPVLIDHSSGYLSQPDSLPGVAIRVWEKLITKVILCFSPDFYGVSKRSMDWLKEFQITAKGVLSNSIDAPSYKQQQSGRRWRDELGIKDSTCLIAYISRLVPEKGVMSLIGSIQQNTAHCDDLALIIAGSGPLRNLVEKTAAKADCPNIHFVGALKPEDASSLLAESDIFCLPTLYPEGLPTVLLEAAVQKNAIIVSDCAGAKDVIPDSKHGTVLERVSEDAIGEAIRRYAQSSSKRVQAANNVYKHVCENFSWEKTAADALKACKRSSEKRSEEEPG